MVTLTVAHGAGDALEELLEGVARSYSRLVSGAPWARFKGRVGMVGSVRALELTHSEKNGWHPHIHALFVVEHEDELMAAGWDWLSERWATVVERQLGRARRPSSRRGVELTLGAHAEYVAKMGLDAREVAGATTKEGHEGHRSHWRLAADLARWGRPRDAELWRELAQWTHGRRQLVWSRGLRALCGADAQTEAARLERLEELGTQTPIAVLTGGEWGRIASVPGRSLELLELAEVAGVALEQILDAIWAP